jgi:hypothetical protein
MVIIKAKVSISTNFSIIKALIIHIISTSFTIIKARPPPLLLLYVNQLHRLALCGKEEKQDQCELHVMPLCREGRSVTRLVVVKQEQEVVNAKDRLLLDHDIKLKVLGQVTKDVLNKR